MNKRAESFRHSRFGFAVYFLPLACFASQVRQAHAEDSLWLTRTIVAKEVALSEAYNTCDLHSLRSDLFVNTRIGLSQGRYIDPIREARDRICGHLHRKLVMDSLVVKRVGDDSALVTGTQYFSAIGTTASKAQASRFSQLWTLDHGYWRIAWMHRYPINFLSRVEN